MDGVKNAVVDVRFKLDIPEAEVAKFARFHLITDREELGTKLGDAIADEPDRWMEYASPDPNVEVVL